MNSILIPLDSTARARETVFMSQGRCGIDKKVLICVGCVLLLIIVVTTLAATGNIAVSRNQTITTATATTTTPTSATSNTNAGTINNPSAPFSLQIGDFFIILSINGIITGLVVLIAKAVVEK